MTFIVSVHTVGTAQVSIGTATPKNIHELTIYNDSNKSLFIGGSAVTTANGFHIPANATQTLKIANGDILYAISTDVDAEAHVYDFQLDP
jgi:hypothetical protein